MQKFYGLFLLLIVFSLKLFSQNANVSFFSEDGEPFYVYLNGTLQNQNATNNIKIEDLPSNNYKAKIIFSDTTLHQSTKTIFLKGNTETVFNIKQKEETAVGNKMKSLGTSLSRDLNMKQPEKGPAELYAVKWFSERDLTVTNQAVYQQQEVRPSTSTPIRVNESVRTTSTTTTTGTATMPAEQVSVKANMMGMNLSMEVNDNTNIQSSSTVTTTHSVTTYGNANFVNNGAVVVDCRPMSSGEFASAVNSVEAKDFEDTRKAMAKQIIDANCLYAAQVKQLLGAFSFEDAKLEIAKYAYSKTVDQNKYYQVNDAFDFESSIEDLNKYIAKQNKL